MDPQVNKRLLLQETDDSECDSQNEASETDVGVEPAFFTSDQKPLFKPHEPVDKYYMCYFIFYLLGITTLLPWNFFITADDVNMTKYWN